MYHPINLPDCPSLERFNELIRLLLVFGLKQNFNSPKKSIKPLFAKYFNGKNVIEDLVRELSLPETDIESSFLKYFTDNKFPKAGKWFWGKPVAIKQPLLALLSLPLAEKQAVLEVFEADMDLAGRFQDGRLRALDISSNYKAALHFTGEIVQNCYTRILATDGVPADVLQMDAPLDRQTILRAYLDVQNQRRDNGRLPPLKVCPGCDGRPPSVADGKIHEDLDHFFPKSRYPLLAVHLLNLTPFCKDCNQTYKRDKDAILDGHEQVTSVHCLDDIFHPYLRPAQNDVEVQVRRLDDGKPHIIIEPRQNDIQQLARLHSLLYTLDVDGRWNGDLIEERVQPELEKLLLHGWQAERDQGSLEMNEEKLGEGLGTVVATLKHFIGREPGNVAALAYARWLAGDMAEQREWLAVLEEVMIKA